MIKKAISLTIPQKIIEGLEQKQELQNIDCYVEKRNNDVWAIATMVNAHIEKNVEKNWLYEILLLSRDYYQELEIIVSRGNSVKETKKYNEDQITKAVNYIVEELIKQDKKDKNGE